MSFFVSNAQSIPYNLHSIFTFRCDAGNGDRNAWPLFHVDLNDEHMKINHDIDSGIRNETVVIGTLEEYTQLAPGPPFVFGAFMVAIAILVAAFIPDEQNDPSRRPSGEKKKRKHISSIHFF